MRMPYIYNIHQHLFGPHKVLNHITATAMVTRPHY